MRLVLWDVDGTLVRCGPIGSEVFDLAIERVLGRHPGPHRVAMSGMTDPLIAREILAFAEVEGSALDDHIAAALVHLERELSLTAGRLTREGHELVGARTALEALAARDDVVQTLLTGNVAANARTKLAAFGLDPLLDLTIGAYGSDHHDRRELVPIARARAERRYSRPFPASSTWVIGDTPRDLECAQAGGARCVLVATGRSPYEELRDLPADMVLRDLSDPSPLLDMLDEGATARG